MPRMMQAARAVGLIDPQQLAIGLRPVTTVSVAHPVDMGAPLMPAVTPAPPPQPITEMILVAPLVTVAQISAGVAIFGTGGGRVVTP